MEILGKSRMLMKISLPALVAGIALSLPGAGICVASTIYYSVTGLDNSSSPGNPIDATALFDLSSSGGPSAVLTLTLTNLEANIQDVGQAVTGIKFNLSQLTGSSTPVSETGDGVTVNSTSSLTDNGLGTLANQWTGSTSLQTVTLSALGGGNPGDSILGPETSGEYPDANGSIAGNGAHNPFVNETATFTFDLTGFTGQNIDSILSAVQIGFGTAGTDYVSATLVPMPEPGSIMLCLGGLGLLAAGIRRRRA